jgi:riboflavin transporter FmnP
MKDSTWKLRRLTVMAMFIALAFAAVAFVRIPVMLWLSYEPKDVLLTIGAFLLGPIEGVIMTVVVSLLELVTISNTGIIGFVMNVFSSCLFVCTASLIYHRKRTLGGALIGLIGGALLATGGMLLWNYLITPLYMANTTRQQVACMLIPLFLPFNALKGGLNAALTMLLYKGVSSTLRAAKLLPPAQKQTAGKKYLPVTILSLLVLTALILAMLAWKGVI